MKQTTIVGTNVTQLMNNILVDYRVRVSEFSECAVENVEYLLK